MFFLFQSFVDCRQVRPCETRAVHMMRTMDKPEPREALGKQSAVPVCFVAHFPCLNRTNIFHHSLLTPGHPLYLLPVLVVVITTYTAKRIASRSFPYFHYSLTTVSLPNGSTPSSSRHLPSCRVVFHFKYLFFAHILT